MNFIHRILPAIAIVLLVTGAVGAYLGLVSEIGAFEYDRIVKPKEDEVVKRDMRKQSIYIPIAMLEEIKQECETYGIPLSKAMQDAWIIARECSCPLPKGVAIFRHKNRKR